MRGERNMPMLKKLVACSSALALLAGPALAQPERKVFMSWAPKSSSPKPYDATNKPITRIADVLARHAGQKSWSEAVVETERYNAKWIQMAPGEKTRTQFYGDDRTVWVVWSGQILFTIQGRPPFVAGKGFLVQVPLRLPYSMETVGTEPSLRFEITRGGALPSYPAGNGEAPPPGAAGQHYVKVSYPPKLGSGGMDSYTEANQPYLDFFKDIVGKYPSGPGPKPLFVGDKDNQADIIRGPGVPTPPAGNKGHFHIGNDEFWFILEGKIDYLIEGVGLITAGQGDIVLALPGRWHRASFAPGQMDTRLAFNRSPTMLHNYGEDAGGKQ
jgi:mannose-6-phosphate isomerase-like protein (cupin superfamily)